MKPYLSIVIASYNDNAELAATVASIRSTTPSFNEEIEIVVVDDCSMMPVAFSVGTKVVRNSRRIGCGPSRYVGALHAKGEYLLICDSHMRFSQGWYEAAKDKLRPKVLHCASCLGLGKTSAGVDNMNLSAPNGVYHGATWNFCGPYRSGPYKDNPRFTQVLECIWAPEQAGDDYPIPAVMGAGYFIYRDWFIYLNALRHLRLWGGDEQELSLKAWLSGGEIRMLKAVRIGHKFRDGKVPSSFVMPHHIIYNKLFIIHTCIPPDLAMRMQMKMQRELQYGIALKALHADWHLILTARAYNEQIFESNFQSLLTRFNLHFPSK